MTKKFCDLCGQPAVEYRSNNRTEHPKLNWDGGTRSGKEDQIYKPNVITEIFFEAHNFRDIQNGCSPDLCLSCKFELAQQLLTKIIENLKLSQINGAKEIVEK